MPANGGGTCYCTFLFPMKAYLVTAAVAVLSAPAAPAHAQYRRSAKPDFPAKNAARTPDTAPNNTPTSANKLQALSYVLDKQVWQFRVHI